VAGVLLALTIPYKTILPKDKLVRMLQDKFNQIRNNAPSPETTSRMIMEEIEEVLDKTSSVSQKLEHTLHGYVLYLIMPIFAMANTGLVLESESFSQVLSASGIGIFLGLVIGKPLGICLFCWIAIKTNVSSFPVGTGWQHIIGAGFLGGIGFTMSIFITLLAFQDPALQNIAKLAVLFASLFAAGAGYLILQRSSLTEPEVEELEQEYSK
jgi:NhaA family Na+:H+ antiporter